MAREIRKTFASMTGMRGFFSGGKGDGDDDGKKKDGGGRSLRASESGPSGSKGKGSSAAAAPQAGTKATGKELYFEAEVRLDIVEG